MSRPISPIAESDLLAEVSRDHLWATNSAIAQWTRNSGTDEERQAFRYVQDTLQAYGLRTTWLEHPALISYPIRSSLSIITGPDRAVTHVASLGTAFSAGVEALEAEVVDLGFGAPDDYARRNVQGKIVLINGLATPTGVLAAEQAGAVGEIFINDDHLHYMIVSTVWGTPTPDSARRLPKTPAVSIKAADGEQLRRQIAAGPTWVRLSSEVFRAWQTTPLLTAELDGQASDDFVLFSGHLDSWEVGAMDNGSANATMMEVGRVLAQHKEHLQRGLRLAFWSGHSHGRYSGSTWYVDNHWEELYDRCVAHVNVDSTGARGATYYGDFPAHQELADLGISIIAEQTGQAAGSRRASRAGDMSFNGVGIPSLFMSLSQVPFQTGVDTDYVSLAQGQLFGGKMPWWWHTSGDTLDKVDLDVLELDTRIYVSTLWRLCTTPLLPMNFGPVMAEIRQQLDDLQQAAGPALDLSVLTARAAQLTDAAASFYTLCAGVAVTAEPTQAAALNRRIKRLSRILIPITYTAAGRFDHDPAWSMPHLPLLTEARRLAQLPTDSDDFHFLRTQLVRHINQIAFAFREALDVLQDQPQ